jgi:hypothetical protein
VPVKILQDDRDEIEVEMGTVMVMRGYGAESKLVSAVCWHRKSARGVR